LFFKVTCEEKFNWKSFNFLAAKYSLDQFFKENNCLIIYLEMVIAMQGFDPLGNDFGLKCL